MLPAPRIKLGTAERATGGEGRDPLAACGAESRPHGPSLAAIAVAQLNRATGAPKSLPAAFRVRRSGPAMLTPSRVAQGLRRRAWTLRYRGTQVLCPVCGHQFGRFKDDWNRPNALCWWCGSHERHRAQWLLFERRRELLANARSLLHFAPEWGLRRRLERRPHLRYVTADLDQPDVDLRLDITAIDLPDATFDAVICSHVLEHVDDDLAAMRELRRITAPDGWCLVMVPLDLGREQTYEDPAITDPAARERAFLQDDHVRLYAPDVGERLSTAGFGVERIRPREEFGDALVERCVILEQDEICLCRPR